MRKVVGVCVLSLCVIIMSWLYHSNVEGQGTNSLRKVRQSLVQRQHIEQRLQRLDEGQASPLLRVLGEDISALQIRLAEYLSGDATTSGFSESPLRYTQSILAKSLSTASLDVDIDKKIQAIRILRLDVQVQLAHSQEFVKVLGGIYSEVGGWPMEVLACDVQRVPIQRLNVRCLMDIYHWSIGKESAVRKNRKFRQ